MTEREMDNHKIYSLIILLYDLCRDILEDYFQVKCLDEDFTDIKLQEFIRNHKSKLYNHAQYSECSMMEHGHNCIEFDKRIFQSFFESFEMRDDIQDIMQCLTIKPITVDDLNVMHLQYLLLAADLPPKTHDWILQMRELRHKVSKVYLRCEIKEEYYQNLWQSTKQNLLDIASDLHDRRQMNMYRKQIDYLSMTLPPAEKALKWINLLKLEFNLEDANLFWNSMNLKVNNIVIGNNNFIYDVPSDVKGMLEEILKRQERNLQKILLKIDEKFVICKFDRKEIDSKQEEVGAVGGLPSKCEEHNKDGQKQYDVVLTFTLPDEIDNISLLEKIKHSLKNMKDSIPGNICIKSVTQGSVIIATVVPAAVVKENDLFVNTIKEFINMIVGKCMKHIEMYTVLVVDVKVMKSVEDRPEEKESKKQNIDNRNDKATQTKLQKEYDKLYPIAGYDLSEEFDIKFGDFPHAKVKACCNYMHIAENQIVESMKNGEVLDLIKTIGDWSEIRSSSGSTFFVLSEYLASEDDKYSPVLYTLQEKIMLIMEDKQKIARDPSTKEDTETKKLSETTQEEPSEEPPEHKYDYINECVSNVKNDNGILEENEETKTIISRINVKPVDTELQTDDNESGYVYRSAPDVVRDRRSYPTIKERAALLEQTFHPRAISCPPASSSIEDFTASFEGHVEWAKVPEAGKIVSWKDMYLSLEESTMVLLKQSELRKYSTGSKRKVSLPVKGISVEDLGDKLQVKTSSGDVYYLRTAEKNKDKILLQIAQEQQTSTEEHQVKEKPRRMQSLPGKSSQTYGLDLKTKSKRRSFSNRFRELINLIGSLLSNSKRPSRSNLVTQGIIKPTVFGSKLEDLPVKEVNKQQIPRFIVDCVAAIEKRGLDIKGIYKWHSEISDTITLRNQVEQGRYDFDSKRWKVYTLIDVLLELLREMPTALLPESLHGVYQQSTEIVYLKENIRKLIYLLPKPYFETTMLLFAHFNRVIQQSDKNGITIEELSNTVGPSLMRPSRSPKETISHNQNVRITNQCVTAIISICITEFDYIFNIDKMAWD